jgi:P-type Cu2+ transporter
VDREHADHAVHRHEGHAEHAGGHALHEEANRHDHASRQDGHEDHAGSHDDHHTGHHGGHEDHARMFRDRFIVSAILTIPILIYAEGLWELFGYTPPDLPFPRAVSFGLATIIYFYGGWIFLTSAVGEVRDRTPGMMTLVAVGITAAYTYSAATTFFLEGEGFYWEMATLVDVMLLGHWIEMRAVGRARSALEELAKLLPDTAERVTDQGVEVVPLHALSQGDVVLLRPGGQVPMDAEVVDGESHVNEAMLTGESRPVAKAPGDEVVAGTVNEEGALRARVTRTGEDTALAGIMRLVREAETSRTKTQALADRAAGWLTYVALSSGAVTALVWALLADRDGDFVIGRAVTVVVIACPHAMGLAIPLVIAITTSLSARRGLLVRDRLALERARNIDVVVFDKTGTLTRGELGMVGVRAADGQGEDRALALAAGLEADSEHALARAVVTAARERGIAPTRINRFEAMKGFGVKGSVDGQEVQIGGPGLLESLGLALPPSLAEAAGEWSREGKTVVTLVEDGAPAAVFALADVIREESRAAVERLRKMGIRVAMITGDSEDVARWVAEEIGLDEHFAQVLPEEKARRVEQLQAGGRVVAMVGDGVNDAPALVQADVGIAIGAGTDVAVQSAGVILVKDDPRDVARVVELSRASYRKMVQNLWWAAGYNIAAIPLAAGVLAPWGIVLVPAVGALLMSVSTVVVAINAQLLRGNRTLARAES